MRWRITIGINRYYLTDEEKQFYLKAVDQGKQYVMLPSGKILSRNFLDIADMKSVKEAETLEKGGRYCSSGTLHEKGDDCYCKMRLPSEL